MGVLKKILSVVLLAVFLLSCVLFVLPQLPRQSFSKSTSATPIVLTLWHVETFEGGVGSRAEWLRGRVREFEKLYDGVYVDVAKLSVAQLKDKLFAGQGFDVVSFGVGVGHLVANRLAPLDCDLPVFDNLLESGQIDSRQYALPYTSGGYLLASRVADLQKVSGFVDLKSNVFDCALQKKVGKSVKKTFSVVLGYNEYCCPLVALCSLSKGAKDFSVVAVDGAVTQYGAYEKFLQGNVATVLLGSQRDYWRLSNRQNNGKIGDVVYSAVEGYTDLTQYVAVSQTTEETKANISRDFANFLLKQSVQSKVGRVGMLSVYDEDSYAEGVMADLQKNLKNCVVPNAFVSQSVLVQTYHESITAIKTGDKTKLKKYISLY